MEGIMRDTTLLVEQKQEEVPQAVQEWLHTLLTGDYAPEDCYIGPNDLEIEDIATLHTLRDGRGRPRRPGHPRAFRRSPRSSTP
jgi:hypothetical protein